MTTTYDPTHATYLDEADVRGELSRVFDVCSGCRACLDLCTTFPTLFELIDRFDDRDAGRLTPAEQDRIGEQCHQCKRCALDCPYAPGLDERAIDVPRLMLRAAAMRRSNGHVTGRDRAAARVLGRSDLFGRLGTAASPVANRLVGARPGARVRRLVSKVTGVSAHRRLPSFARRRFSTWFAARPSVSIGDRQGRVIVFPTCLVEYQEPRIGQDLVKVYERNGIECDVTSAGCCGAPWLHAGDLRRFTRIAERNVATLAAEIRAGTDVVVAQPTCAYVLKVDYGEHVGGLDATLVAEHTFDVSQYLLGVHGRADAGLDTDFGGDVPASITYQVPGHVRAQQMGLPSRDLMQLTGAEVTVVQHCSGVDGLWGLRAGNDEAARPTAVELGARVGEAGGDVVAGDCHLANTVVTEQTGRVPQHPIQVVARAYGIVEEPG